MGQVKVVLNYQGIQEELLKSQWALDCCKEAADLVANRAGDGYVSEYVGQRRVNVSVHTTTDEAAQDNLDNNTLLKALGG